MGRSYAVVILVLLCQAISHGQVLLGEVLVRTFCDKRLDGAETVGLINYGDQTQDLTGWSLQSTPAARANLPNPDRWTFPANTAIEPGNRLTVYWNEAGEDRADALYTGATGLSPLDDEAGDLALVSPAGIEHYLEWGAPGQGLEAAAVAAGKWKAGESLTLLDREWGCFDGWGFEYVYRPSGDFQWQMFGESVVVDAVQSLTLGVIKAYFLPK